MPAGGKSKAKNKRAKQLQSSTAGQGTRYSTGGKLSVRELGWDALDCGSVD